MKVFFSCSTNEILKYKNEYKAIRDTVKSLGHSLTRDWLDKSIELAVSGQKDVPISRLYSDVVSAILMSDVVIFEGTVRSTSLGHQLTYALEKNKPVLFLTQESGEQLNYLFISGARTSLLTIKNYTKNNLAHIITDYLANNNGDKKVRFNLVIDKPQDNYIEWASYNYKMSKTEVIKQAINKLMRLDKKYQIGADKTKG